MFHFSSFNFDRLFCIQLALPVELVFPTLFIRAATRKQEYVKERLAMYALKLQVRLQSSEKSGKYSVMFAYIGLWMWTALCIFACLVYGT